MTDDDIRALSVAVLNDQNRRVQNRQSRCVDGKILTRLEKRVRDAERAVERARVQSIRAKDELQTARNIYAHGGSCTY